MKDKRRRAFECAITSRVLYGPEVLQMRIIGWRKTIVTNDTTSTWCTGPCLSFIVLLIKKTHLIDKGVLRKKAERYKGGWRAGDSDT